MTARRNIITGQKVSPTMPRTAKQLRRRMTPEERVLWELLRAKRLVGLHFRRQQVIDHNVVDFYCHAAGIAVEVDGTIHARQVERDQERDAILTAHGLRILRFKNDQIQGNLASVLRQIADACQVQPTSQM